MADSHSLGIKGEDLGVRHLVDKGYTILHRNWKSGKKEVDIVAENDEFIVFAEVKTRTGNYLSSPGETVSREKQRLLLLAAESYLRIYNINKESRFDIITIISKGQNYTIEHLENAFYPTLR